MMGVRCEGAWGFLDVRKLWGREGLRLERRDWGVMMREGEERSVSEYRSKHRHATDPHYTETLATPVSKRKLFR
ncbi:hypothetical protein E2C01_000218 [Portunus trituberculatus]|uniref:Uncharacterized protein n=1 Tax=Portunus trituberculatus TaxID=210409 RepID=A0A5B7CJ19_PORTR|nr:hypothetical protein [Portunus trituberculatus]